MSDIWSGIGVDIRANEGEWLYRIGSEMRGPLPFRALVDKLLRGEIDVTTSVAREGGDFHPIVRVAAFAPHLADAKKRAKKRAVRKSLRLIGFVLLLVAGGVGAGGYIFWQDYQKAAAKRAAEAKAEAAALVQKREKLKALPKMGLVALVSLGTEADV